MSGLPKHWSAKESKSHPGKFYYYNDKTGETTWIKPVEGEEVRCLHILRKHVGSRRPSSWRQEKITCSKEEAIEKIKEFRKEIMEAEDKRAKFEEIAKKESDCSSAGRGGDLGKFGRGKMQKSFEQAAFKLNVGEISDVVDSDSGIHIIMRIE